MPIAKVVYPTPPPTTNNLTTKQRSLLLRKAKKIEQILGYPPHLINTLYSSDGTSSSSPFTSPSAGRSSIESSSSTLASLDLLRNNKDDVSWFCYPHGSRKSAIPSHNNGLSQIPLLRATSKSLRFELVAMTNWPVKPSFTMSLSEQLHGSHETCTPPPSESDLQLKSSLTDPPTFTIPTSHTHRKAKMDRIWKRLGSEVPCEVVFPEDLEQEPGNSLGRKWSTSERRTSRRKDAIKPLPLPNLSPSNPTHRPSERRCPPVLKVANEKLSFIPECPDESSEGWQELTVDCSRMEDGFRTPRRRDTAESTCSENSDDYGQGVVTFRKRHPSYRKPPPPMLDDSVCPL